MMIDDQVIVIKTRNFLGGMKTKRSLRDVRNGWFLVLSLVLPRPSSKREREALI